MIFNLKLFLNKQFFFRIFFLILLKSSFYSFSQTPIKPIVSSSFGLNHYTNRDLSYFTLADNQKNVFIVGTTERDSTFTDIITFKFDQNLNLKWQKIFSIDTGLSYDVPISICLDSGGNLIVIGRSSYRKSRTNGLIFIVKYDTYGNEIWSKTLGNIDGSDYYDYSFFYSTLENDKLKICYVATNSIYYYIDTEIKYLTIDINGDIVEETSEPLVNNTVDGTYKNGIYYNLMVHLDGDINKYTLLKKSSNINEKIELNQQSGFVAESYSPLIYALKYLVDNNENLYLVKPNIEGNIKNISYTKINKSGTIEFSKTINSDVTLLDSYIDDDTNLYLKYLTQNKDSIKLIKIDNGSGEALNISNIAFSNYSGSKINDDKSLFLVNENDDILLLNKDLSIKNQFKFLSYYKLEDLLLLNNDDIILTGSTYEKMYEKSDFYSQNDIIVEKLNNTEILKSYRYSGLGTSGNRGGTLLIDKNDNYIILTQDYLGPNNFSIGGSRAPQKIRLIKYNSDLDKLWELELPDLLFEPYQFILDKDNNIFINIKKYENYISDYKLIKISSEGQIIFIKNSFQSSRLFFDENENINSVLSRQDYPNYTYYAEFSIFNSTSGDLIEQNSFEKYNYINSYKSNNNDSYLYLYTDTEENNTLTRKLIIYKNKQLLFEKKIDTPLDYGGLVGDFNIGSDGSLYFYSVEYASQNPKLNKLTLSNEYNTIDLTSTINHLKIIKNDKLLMVDKNGYLNLFDSNLSLISSSSEGYYEHPYIDYFDDYILHYTYFTGNVRILNQNMELISKFKLRGTGNSNFDSKNNLITSGTFGYRIYLYDEYKWSRGFIDKYDIYKQLANPDQDFDGILNDVDNCVYVANYNQLDTDNDSVGDACDDNDDGDAFLDNEDYCPLLPTLYQFDADSDGIGNACDDDDDNDYIKDDVDNCSLIANNDQLDSNGDGVGDACTGDFDGDGTLDDDDNCKYIRNIDQSDVDADGIGDVCDDDIDNDGILNENDKCNNTPAGGNVDNNGCLSLPTDNLNIETTGETCLGKNNAQIHITAVQSFNYLVRLNDVVYTFTNDLTINKLTPGVYNLSIEVTSDSFIQQYVLNLPAGSTISARSSILNNTMYFDVERGEPPYKVLVNNKQVLETNSTSFTINVKMGDSVELKTNKACEGTFSKTIALSDFSGVYPNPTTGNFEIIIPISNKNILVDLYTIQSKLISSKVYSIVNGKITLSLKGKPTGIYIVKLYFDKPIVLKILKQ